MVVRDRPAVIALLLIGCIGLLLIRQQAIASYEDVTISKGTRLDNTYHLNVYNSSSSSNIVSLPSTKNSFMNSQNLTFTKTLVSAINMRDGAFDVNETEQNNKNNNNENENDTIPSQDHYSTSTCDACRSYAQQMRIDKNETNINGTTVDMQRVFVASHRRSGTHLTMNFIANHFFSNKPPYLCVKKMNHLVPDSVLTCDCLLYLLGMGQIVYVERPFPDVLQSMFFYMKSYGDRQYGNLTTLEAFLKNDKLVVDIAFSWNHTSTTWRALAKQRPGCVHIVEFKDVLDGNRSDTTTRDALSAFLHRSPNPTPTNRKEGVQVGSGKGLQVPPALVKERAAWAMDQLHRNPSITRGGKWSPFFGHSLDLCGCTATRSSFIHKDTYQSCPLYLSSAYKIQLISREMELSLREPLLSCL